MSASSRKSERGMNIRATLVAMALTLSIAAQAEAQLTNSTFINFHQPTGTVVNGLTIQNVMFNYYVNGVESNAATLAPVAAPTCLTFLCGGALQGDALPNSQLVMTFINPMWYFEFSLAREFMNSAITMKSWVGPPMVGSETGLDLWDEGYGLFEGEFTLDPADGPQNYLKRVEITFGAGASGKFWIDDIEGQHALMAVPEPGTGLLLLTGLLGLALIARGRRESASVHDAT